MSPAKVLGWTDTDTLHTHCRDADCLAYVGGTVHVDTLANKRLVSLAMPTRVKADSKRPLVFYF
jgi:hypothetical protein